MTPETPRVRHGSRFGKSRRDIGVLGALLLATVALAVTSIISVRQEGARRQRLIIETHQAVAGLLAGRIDESMRRVAAAIQAAIDQEYERPGTLFGTLRRIEAEHSWLSPLVVVAHESAPNMKRASPVFDDLLAAAERHEHQLEHPREAAALYGKAADVALTAVERLEARNGQARSHLKAGDVTKARALYESLESIASDLDPQEVKWSVIAQSQLLEYERLSGDEKAYGTRAVSLFRFLTEHRFMLDADLFQHYRGMCDRAKKSRLEDERAYAQIARRNEELDPLDRLLRESMTTSTPLAIPDPRAEVVVTPVYARDDARIVGGVAYPRQTRNLTALTQRLLDDRGPWSGLGVALLDGRGQSAFSTVGSVPDDVRQTSSIVSTLPAWRVATFPKDGSVATSASRDIARYAGWLALVFCTVVAALALAARSIARELRLARLRTDFVASVSHELRTPLALIRMFGESLREGWVEERQKHDYYEVITRESERLTGLIDNVLDFSRLESGLRTYQLVSTDLRGIVADLLDRYEFHLKAAGIDLIRDLPDAPVYSRVDRDAIEQVIVNLLSNAVKYMGPADRPARRVGVALIVEDTRVTLRVSDTGIGMANEDRVHIFERFYRAHDDSVAAVAGSGLGLTLAKAHVDAHGGTIDVESIPGKGSTFVISLPMGTGSHDL